MNDIVAWIFVLGGPDIQGFAVKTGVVIRGIIGLEIYEISDQYGVGQGSGIIIRY